MSVNSSLQATPLPFEQQIRYFKNKVNIPTETYLDIYGELHDYAFVVAGANTQQLVLDFRKAVDKAIQDGITLEQFRKDFDDIVKNHSWQYNGGRNWRSRVIYDTNLYASYNYGRYVQQREMVDLMPYWKYEHHDNNHPRLEHKRLDNLVLRADDPFWSHYYPTRAYGCHCTVRALDDIDLQQEKLTVSPSPNIEWEERTIGQRSGNPRVVRLPKGVDPSFEHEKRLVPVQTVDKLLMQHLLDAPAEYASNAVTAVLNYAPAMALLNQSMADMVDNVTSTMQKRGEMKYVGAVPREVIKQLDDMGIAPQTAVIAVRDEDILHALRDTKTAKGIHLPAEFWKHLPDKLKNPDAILLQNDKGSHNLLFVFSTEQGKVVVKMDYEIRVKDKLGKRKVKVNVVRTASIIGDLTSLHEFEILWGKL